MLRWWDPRLFDLLSMMTPYVPLFLVGIAGRFRREVELWRWRREYERLPQAVPNDSPHPITRALGLSSPSMSPLMGWSEPAPRPAGASPLGESSQLKLF